MAIATSIIVAASVAAAAGAGAAVYGSRQARKAEESAQDFAERQQQEAKTEARRAEGKIEEATKLTPQEIEREQRLFGVAEGEEKIELGEGGVEQARQAEVTRRAGLPGEELLAEAGPTTRRLLEDIAGEQGMTGEELYTAGGEIPSLLVQKVLERGRDPAAGYESTLAPELEQARQMVNAEALKRGTFGGLPEGGIRFEQLGRAGIDLAIKSAQERENARQTNLANMSALATQFQNLRESARGREAAVGEAALGQSEQARAEEDAFIRNLQALVQESRGRAGQGVVAGQQIATPITREAAARRSDIETDIFGGQIQAGRETQQAGLKLIGQAGAAAVRGIPTPTTGTPGTSRYNLSTIRGQTEEEQADLFRLTSRAGR